MNLINTLLKPLILLLYGGTFMGISYLSAQPASGTWSVEECIEYALENNKNIQNAKFDEYIAKAKVKEVVASGLPQINGSADAQYFLELPTSILPREFNTQQEIVYINDQPYPLTKLDPQTLQPVFGDPIEVQFGFPWQSTLGVSVNQLVADGTYFLGLEAAKVYVTLAEKGSKRTREETAYAVSKAYYQALIAEEQKNLLNANLERLKKLLFETNALYEEGFAEKLDVDRLKISYTNLELEKKKVERFAALSKDMLKFQMGLPITEELILSEEVNSIRESPEMSISNDPLDPGLRIEYSILQTQLELETYNMKRYKVGYLPSLYAFGSYQWNAQRNEFNLFDTRESWFPIGVVGLQLNVPIFDGFRKRQQIQQSKLEIRKIENQFSILENSIQLEVRNARARLFNAYNSLETYRKNADLAQQVFDLTQVKYKEGVGSSLELNDAESQLKQAESSYLSGIFEYVMAKIDLQKAGGEFAKYHTN